MSMSGQVGSSAHSSEIVAAVDDDGSSKEFVIADITADGAWLSMAVEDAPSLPACR
jgi:hypothetical protein